MLGEVEFRSPEGIILDALRDELRRLLFYCTQEQNDMLLRIYRFGIDGMKESELKSAIGLAQRTIIKNRKKNA